MKQLIMIFKKYKIPFLTSLTILVLGVITLVSFQTFHKTGLIKELTNSVYQTKYDDSWKIKDESDSKIIFQHKKSKSLLTIEIIPLEGTYAYATVEDMVDEILYTIESQNKDYKIISKNEDVFTKNKYSGYKALYEDGNHQVLIMVYKKGEKLIFSSYEATNDYFDILLDSVHNIVYNFDVKEEQFPLKEKINIDLTEATYDDSEYFKDKFTKTTDYYIASDHYYVSYAVPSEFSAFGHNTLIRTHNYRNDKPYYSISLGVSVYPRNIYEMLDKEESSNVFKKQIYEKDENVIGIEEQLSYLGNPYNRYLYHLSYDEKCELYGSIRPYDSICHYEMANLLFTLDRNHVFDVEIRSTHIGIPKNLIDNIKINKIENYSTYVENHIEGDNIISELIDSYDYKNDYRIILKVPKKYTEYNATSSQDLTEEKFFGLNYNEDTNLYDYKVEYQLGTIVDDYEEAIKDKVDFVNDWANKNYKYDNMKRMKDLNINGHTLVEYAGGNEDLGGILFTNIDRFLYYIDRRLLFYKINDDNMLVIEIEGNGKKVTDDIIKDLTNFDLVIEEVKTN